MINIIIFSGSNLVQYALKLAIHQVVNEVLNSVEEKLEVSISECNLFYEVEVLMSQLQNPFIIIDTDNLSRLEKYHDIFLVNQRLVSPNILLYAKDGDCYNDLNNIPHCFVKKDAEFSKLKEMLRYFLFDYKPNNALKNKISRRGNSELTKTEGEVLKYILAGLSNKEISANLKISTKAISDYKRKIYKKYQVSNVIGLYWRFKK